MIQRQKDWLCLVLLAPVLMLIGAVLIGWMLERAAGLSEQMQNDKRFGCSQAASDRNGGECP